MTSRERARTTAAACTSGKATEKDTREKDTRRASTFHKLRNLRAVLARFGVRAAYKAHIYGGENGPDSIGVSD